MTCTTCGAREPFYRAFEYHEGKPYCPAFKGSSRSKEWNSRGCYYTRRLEAIAREAAGNYERVVDPALRLAAQKRPNRIRFRCPCCQGYETNVQMTYIKARERMRRVICSGCSHKFNVPEKDMDWPRITGKKRVYSGHNCPKCNSEMTQKRGFNGAGKRLIHCLACDRKSVIVVRRRVEKISA